MTDDQRQRLDRLADRCDDWPCNYEDFEAVGAALTEIDRLRAELAEAWRQNGESKDKLLAAKMEISLCATRIAQLKAEPPRPAAIVLPPDLYAAYEWAAQTKNMSVNDYVIQFLEASRRASPLL